MQITEINKILTNHNINADTIELYQENGEIKKYLIDGNYILKISTSALSEQVKQERVKFLDFAPIIHSYGSFVVSDCKYNYELIDYVKGNELWSVAQSLTDNDKYSIGKDIAQFLNKLHTITDDFYDIGHYIPTVPRYKKSWKEGHIEYAAILEKGISEINLEPISQKIISKTFEYIYGNIDSLDYQTGAKLLHNDFHPKNIIVNESKLAGVIDWECSQYGEPDFELSRLFDWCVYPESYLFQENNLEILLKSVIENSQIISVIPHFEKRMTIYQLEHEINQLIWSGKKYEEERMKRINGWLENKVSVFLKRQQIKFY